MSEITIKLGYTVSFYGPDQAQIGEDEGGTSDIHLESPLAETRTQEWTWHPNSPLEDYGLVSHAYLAIRPPVIPEDCGDYGLRRQIIRENPGGEQLLDDDVVSGRIPCPVPTSPTVLYEETWIVDPETTGKVVVWYYQMI